MTKFVKMSLVAALAVAGTTASAQPLAEAIKNVDVSGAATYRYDDNKTDAKGSNSINAYKVTANLKSKVTDDVVFNVSFQAGKDGVNDSMVLNTQTAADGNLDVELTKANFAYTGLANTTVVLGKQSIQTPWTASAGSALSFNEQTGTGLLATTSFGPITAVGAYFNQTNFNTLGSGDNSAGAKLAASFSGAENVYTVGLVGKAGPVSLDAWYLDVADVLDSYTIGASYKQKVGAVKLGFALRHSSLSFDDLAAAVNLGQADEDSSLTKAKITAKAGIFSGKLEYGVTDDDGGLVALDKHSKNAMVGWLTYLNGQRDAQYLKASVGAQVFPKLNISVNYNDLDSDANDAVDATEIYAQFVYKHSKNLKAIVRLGQKDVDNNDNDMDAGRLHFIYKF